ncbi:MAG: acyltransferase family protein [Bryobacteraceae bacterium]
MSRFLVCLLVVVAHSAPVALVGATASIVLNSGICSTIFFALSGYIICSTAGFWREPFLVFARRRMGRLLPVHWFGFAIAIPWMFLGVDTEPVLEVAEAVLWWTVGLQGFLWGSHTDLYSQFNPPAWSVTPLLYGTIALPVLKLLRLRDWNAARLTLVMAAIWLVRLSITFFIHVPGAVTEISTMHARPEGHMLEILLGGMAAILLSKPSVRSRLLWLGSGRSLAVIAAATSAAVTIAAVSGGRYGAFYLVHGPIFPLAVLLVASAHANDGAVERFCTQPWVKTAGEMSILVFLLHMPFLHLASRVLARLDLETSAWAGTAAMLAVITSVTAASYTILPVFRRAQRALCPTRTDLGMCSAAADIPVRAVSLPPTEATASLAALSQVLNDYRYSPEQASRSEPIGSKRRSE